MAGIIGASDNGFGVVGIAPEVKLHIVRGELDQTILGMHLLTEFVSKYCFTDIIIPFSSLVSIQFSWNFYK